MSTTDLAYRNRVSFTLSHKALGYLVITEPIGWNDDEKEYARNKKYHGVFTKFSNSLEFVENGADFINNVKNFHGVNAEIRLVKKERHPITDRWVERYNGVLDLSTWSEEDFKVKVKFNSSGLETELKARESEKIEIERITDLDGGDLEPLETRELQLDGRNIFLLSAWETSEVEKTVVLTTYSDAGNTRSKLEAVPLVLKTKSHETAHSTTYRSQYEENNANSGALIISPVSNSHTYDVDVNLSFFYRILERDLIDWTFFKVCLTKYKNGIEYDNPERVDLLDITGDFSYQNTNFNITENLIIDLEPNDSLSLEFFIKANFKNSGTRRADFDVELSEINCSLTIKEDSFSEKSTTKIVEATTLGDRLVKILTGREDAFVCDYLSTINKGYAHGHWIRNFDALPVSDDNKYKPFTTSFKDFIEDLDVTEGLGLAIEKIGYREQVVLRPKKEFYNNLVLIRLPNQVTDLKRKTISKNYYSSIITGYTKGWDNEEALGLDEYNAQSSYVSPILRVVNVFKKVSKYIYASYAGEFIRRRPILTNPTDDHRNDKEIFPFDMKPDFNGYKLNLWEDVLEEKPTGVYSPETAYNLSYSPFNLLLKHGWFIAGAFVQNITDYVRFGSSEGNSNLSTKLIGGHEYKENGDVICSELGRARFVPEEIKFSHEVSYDIQEQLEGETEIDGKKVKNIYGVIEFTNEKGNLEHGYFEKLKPNGKGTWTLIKANR